MVSNVLKGSIFVGLGACCYGMLGSFVKLAYSNGFTTAEVSLSQFAIGFAGLCVLTLFRSWKSDRKRSGFSITSKLKLIVAGTSLGLTSVFYYMAVKYIAVSVAIVLLMQSVWMSVILEAVTRRTVPPFRKIIAVLMVLAGTVLATHLLKHSVIVNWHGFGYGMLAALCYSATMYSSDRIERNLPPLTRSLYMIVGGLIIIALVFHSSLIKDFSYRIFSTWGLLIALFGTILPPLLFTTGMPLTGIGRGAIIAALEIPVAIFMASALLNESVVVSQWIGIALILAAVITMNMNKVRRRLRKGKVNYKMPRCTSLF